MIMCFVFVFQGTNTHMIPILRHEISVFISTVSVLSNEINARTEPLQIYRTAHYVMSAPACRLSEQIAFNVLSIMP